MLRLSWWGTADRSQQLPPFLVYALFSYLHVRFGGAIILRATSIGGAISYIMLFRYGYIGLLYLVSCLSCEAFVPSGKINAAAKIFQGEQPRQQVSLQMGLDMVTYLRTEWICAALCTNQTPRSADVCLQIGCDDGRAVTFIPRTIRELITSTLQSDGLLPVSVRRQLKQQQERRGAAKVTYVDQRADDLKEVADESVDVVISLLAAARMLETGLDWKKSVREAARVLKPGGRLLFVEQTTLEGESYLDYVMSLVDDEASGDEEAELFSIWDDMGYDDVDLVIVPHVAGVAIKAEDAGLTSQDRAKKEKQVEQEKLAEVSIAAFERGIKKRKRKKKKKGTVDGSEDSA